MQEVRGVETQRVIYKGDDYTYSTRSAIDHYVTSNEYYGFKFTNKNSFSVSVSIEVYQRGQIEDRIAATKEVILISGESYVIKEPTIYKICKEDGRRDNLPSEETGKRHADQFYVKYKAYRLL